MTDSGTVYLNGDFVPAASAKVSVFDRGFMFGDGVYEVVPVRTGKIVLLQRHLDRLRNSLGQAAIDCHLGDAEWRQILQHLLKEHHYQQCSMYLQVTRGVDYSRSHVAQQQQATVFAACLKSLKSPPQHGVKVATTEDIRWHWCHIKSICLLPNVLLRRQAAELDCYEMLLVGGGKITEGAASNVFVVNPDGVVLTPPLGENILPGITRQLLLEALAADNIPYREHDIEAATLPKAKEIWLSSSGGGLIPVIEVDGNPIADGKPGQLWRKAAQLLAQAEQAATTTEDNI